MVARHSLLIVLTNNHLFVVLLLYLELRRPLVVLILGEQRRPFKGEAGDQLVSGWKEGGGEPQVALCVCVCAHTVSVSVRALCLCLRVCTVSVFVRVPVSVRVHCVCVFALCVSVQALCLRSYLVFDRRRSCFYPGYHTCAGNSAVYYSL